MSTRPLAVLAATLCAAAIPLVVAAGPRVPAVQLAQPAVRTLPLPDGISVESATYTPSGSVLLAFRESGTKDPRDITLATVNDNGTGLRRFFSKKVPERAKDLGLRYMVFADNKRLFTGDFVIECREAFERCSDPALLPVRFPAEVAEGTHIAHRWTEIVVAPDNRHVAWTTLLSDYSAVNLIGELERRGDGYTIVKARILSTLDPFRPDPAHPGGVLPQLLRGGEVKQFVHGGTALSFAGGIKSILANSTVLQLASGTTEAVTDTPGYTETTIFSPDERLGITMTTRFSPSTDLAVLGLVPRPYPATLNMGLNMFAYTYGVTGVRKSRPGNVGPALIDIQASKTLPGYVGTNLNTSPNWVFYSPMSWHPTSKKALWVEGLRGADNKRVQIAPLIGYRPGPVVRPKAMPDAAAYARSDLSVIPSLVGRSQNIDARVYGRASGHVTYRRTPTLIEKVYTDFSDDGRAVWSGRETTKVNPAGNSSYVANFVLSGAAAGKMDLVVTFGPLGGLSPARMIFEPDADGLRQTRGFAEYQGKRLTVSQLVP